MINDSINRFLGVMCYPFTSLDFFHRDRLREYLQLKHKTTPQLLRVRDEIQREVIQYMSQNYSIYSYDEINLYCDKCYFYNEINCNHEFYIKYFKNLAQSLISHRNGKIIFKYWENELDNSLLGGFSGNNKIYLFHSLLRHIPLDFITMVYINMNSYGKQDVSSLHGFYGNIEVADQLLAKVLSSGVSENHLHSGVSRTFLSVWDTLMKYQEKQDSVIKKLLPLDNNSLFPRHKLHFYVNVCRIIRIIISLEIVHKGDFLMNKRGSTYSEETKDLLHLLKAFGNGKDLEAIYEASTKKDSNEAISYIVSMWEVLYKRMSQFYSYDEANLIRDIFKVGTAVKTYDEIIFLYYAMQHYLLPEKELKDTKINELILQYIRIRNFVFNLSVQQKTTKGLDYFQIKKYKKNSIINKINNSNFWEYAIREQFQNTDLIKIEFRLSLDQEYANVRRNVKAFLESYLRILQEEYCSLVDGNYIVKRGFPKVGLVFHLLKRYDDFIPDKCLEQGETNEEKLQYGVLQKSYITEIENLLTLRKEDVRLTKYLVGIDAASLENSTPVWVFNPVFGKARGSEVEPIGGGTRANQSLGFTFHAGEDFRHILSGLRRVDEVVTALKFHAGDRIGHGIALGIDAVVWKYNNPIVVMPRIEVLDNYLWAYHILSQNYAKFDAVILAYLENVIYQMAKGIYKSTEGLTTAVLVEGYLENLKVKLLEDLCVEAMRGMFCEQHRRKSVIWNSQKLIYSRHCKFYTKQMYEPISREVTKEDIVIVQELQHIMRQKLSQIGIVIEVNPSSNLAIGDLDKVTENQLYQISNIQQEDSLIACVNSDDPTVFNTNVSNELAFVYYGMLAKGVGKERALQWIDKIRKNGVDASFIQRENETDQYIFDELCKIVESM